MIASVMYVETICDGCNHSPFIFTQLETNFSLFSQLTGTYCGKCCVKTTKILGDLFSDFWRLRLKNLDNILAEKRSTKINETHQFL